MQKIREAIKLLGPQRVADESGFSHTFINEVARNKYHYNMRAETRQRIINTLVLCLKEDEDKVDTLRDLLQDGRRYL